MQMGSTLRIATRTIREALRELAAAEPDHVLLVCDDERVSADRADRDASALGLRLSEAGLRSGDRVGLWMPNGRWWAAGFFGAVDAGRTVVPLNIRYRADELVAVLSHARAAALVTSADERRSGVLAEVRRRLPHLKVIDPEPASIEAGVAAQVPTAADPEAIALTQYTSGTTAMPKGVELRHTQVLRNAWELGERLDVRAGDRYASGMPFYHVGGSVLSLLLATVRRATLVTQARFVAGELLARVAAERCTHLFGVETMFVELLGRPDLDSADLRSLRVCFAGGRPDVLAEVRRRLCPIVVNRYGLTEASGNVSCTEIGDPPEVQLHSAGRPLPGLELRIAEADRPLPPGASGEIQIRGWAVMKGYLDDPDATRAAISTDGWLRTGDLGVLDGDGRLRFLGRTKDTIRVGGENVSVAEIEELVGGFPGVSQVAVVPVEDERLGEVPVAFVEMRGGGTADEAALIDYCRQRAAGFKAPRHVRFVQPGQWPLTGSGKIRKVELREQARALRSVRA